jgi:hypothetical protein
VDFASRNDHLVVLQWWKNSGLVCKMSKYAIDLAFQNGRLDVLDWWREFGINFDLFNSDM